MRQARVYIHGIEAGVLKEQDSLKYEFIYSDHYHGTPVSLTMPLTKKKYEFKQFPPCFEGWLPEGILLEALMRKFKLDQDDYFGQLLQVGQDLVGAVTVERMP